MNGKLDAVIESISFAMGVNPNYIVDCQVRPEDFDYMVDRIVDLLGWESEVFARVNYMNKRQVVLQNGSELNLIGSGRGWAGRNPTFIVLDETLGDKTPYTKGAPVVPISEEDRTVA